MTANYSEPPLSGDSDTGPVVFNPTGVPGLDVALGGGLPRDALTLVSAHPAVARQPTIPRCANS